jgi:hypothetical protein
MEVLFYESWRPKSRRRVDSIYLQKYHDLFVPKDRQELEKGKIKSTMLYIDGDNHKGRDTGRTDKHK